MRFAAAAAVALLAGCTKLESYRPPEAGPSADLRVFGNALGGTITIVALEAPGCGDGEGRLIARLHQRQPPDLRYTYLSDGAPAPAPAADARVPAARRMAFLVQAQGLLDGWYGYGCARAASFVPQSGARYEAVYVAEDPYRCRIDMWRVESERRTMPEDYTQHPSLCPLRAYSD